MVCYSGCNHFELYKKCPKMEINIVMVLLFVFYFLAEYIYAYIYKD